MPAVSVVMPVYNGVRFLDRAVASVRRQTFPDWELLAVDDASADASAARLDALATADPRVRVFRHPANRGPAAARNTALAAARGDLVAYLDCDDEFYPDHLARAWDHRDKADVLLFRYDQVEDRPGAPGYGRVTPYDPAARREFLFAETIAVPLGVVHRRDLIARVGGFDEGLWRDEDGDLWRRFARAGARFTAVPHPSGRYYIRADSLARIGRAGSPDPPPGVSVVEIARGADRYPMWVRADLGWLARDVFERHEYGGVPRHVLRDPPVVLDVGANAGLFALYARLTYHPAAVVHCFEPCPSTLDLLRRNVARLPGVTVHPVGLGRRDADADLLVHPTNSAAHSLDPALVSRPAARVRVRVRDAGAVWDELGLDEVDVLKVDAEGAEVGVLEALGPRLARVRAVLLEYHSAADRRRVDARLPGHVLFGAVVHDLRHGVVKYVRADLAGPMPPP
ncbi:MAG: epsH 2 [Gemmataceae bacterium]|nr:epsH 2 [Gemmataceae bacterium]